MADPRKHNEDTSVSKTFLPEAGVSSIVRPNSDEPNLTREAYEDLQAAMHFFNFRLFGGELPDCILSFVRRRNLYGYFCVDRFENRTGVIVHEIAMNPIYLQSCGDAFALSVLVHELCHLWRHVLGPVNRSGGKGSRGYHDLVWANKMLEVGLRPTDTGLPDGKMTGYSVSHLIVEGGQFDLDCKELLASGLKLNWRDRLLPAPDEGPDDADSEGEPKPEPEKKKDRVKFTCAECGLNAWAKPSARFSCMTCNCPMQTADGLNSSKH